MRSVADVSCGTPSLTDADNRAALEVHDEMLQEVKKVMLQRQLQQLDDDPDKFIVT